MDGKFEFVDLSHFAGKSASPEDTVALLCAAARKWAKWDARMQALLEQDRYSHEEFLRLLGKSGKWRDRTLSYGHHLLSAGAPKKAVDRECCVELSPAFQPEINRLDALVQQLRARVANLEEAGG